MATEQRLIDANAIYDAVERRYQVSSGIEHRCERDLLDLICSTETVDAAPVVHGRWELHGNDDDCGCSYFCSNCHKSHDEDYFYAHGQYIPYHYCPNCGAKMDGGNGDAV